MEKIGLVIAMEKEMEMIKGHLGKTVKVDVFAGKPLYINEFRGKKLYLAVSSVGEIAAAAATQMLIDRYDVDIVINFGLAGALNEKLKRGQFVLAGAIVHYDFDTSALDNCEVGRYMEFDGVRLPIDVKYADILSRRYELPRVTVCSGDKFIGDRIKKEWLIDSFGGDICEMEAAGIALTSIRSGVPALFIKVISDNADENSTTDFGDFLKISATTAGDMLADLIGQL